MAINGQTFYKHFITDNKNQVKKVEITSMEQWERFLTNYYYLTSMSFGHYMNCQKPTYRRLLISQCLKLSCSFVCLRYGISALFDTPMILWLTSNANYILG